MAIMLDICCSVFAADEGVNFQAQIFGGCLSIHMQIFGVSKCQAEPVPLLSIWFIERQSMTHRYACSLQKKKKNCIFSSQPRANQMPGPPWEGQLMCTLFLSMRQ